MSDIEYYNKKWNEKNFQQVNKSFEVSQRKYEVMKQVKKACENNENCELLEIGCGMGIISRELVKFGNVFAIDLATEGPKPIWEKLMQVYDNLKFKSGNFLDFDFHTKIFTTIVTSEVIEHIPKESQQKFLIKSNKLLKECGKIIITTPNGNYDSLANDEDNQPIENHLNPNELKKLVENSGFKIMEQKIFFPDFWQHKTRLFKICQKLHLLRILYIPFIYPIQKKKHKDICKYQYIYAEKIKEI